MAKRMKERMKAVGRRGERKLDTPLESRILFVMVNAEASSEAVLTIAILR